jgi:archaellum biogenesis ATPase FlaH
MNTLLSKSKPLLIHGGSGTGKSYLSVNLSDNMVVTKIDSSMLKTIKSKDYLLDIIKKHNVTMMFSEKKENRCLLIDDIHIFHKYDRTFIKIFIEFIKERKYYNTYIIFTCNNSFLKNKELMKIKKYISYHEIKYSYNEYYKSCLRIAKDNQYKYSLDDLDKKIYFSGYNFNDFKSMCEETINNKDNWDPIETITNDLINNKYAISELFRICHGDEIILAYNLLENLEQTVNNNLSKYYKIYNNFVNSDIIEYNIVKYDKELSIKYLSILSLANINYYINMKCKNITMNKYISKCMVLTNVKTIPNFEFMIYIIDSVKKYNDEDYKLKLTNNTNFGKIEKIYKIFY